MKIRFHPPLDRLAGGSREMDFSHPVSVADLLRLLKRKMPFLVPYIGFSPPGKQAHGILIWKGQKLLELDDMLLPNDCIEIIVMAAGG